MIVQTVVVRELLNVPSVGDQEVVLTLLCVRHVLDRGIQQNIRPRLSTPQSPHIARLVLVRGWRLWLIPVRNAMAQGSLLVLLVVVAVRFRVMQ